jgi:hypothetical protein
VPQFKLRHYVVVCSAALEASYKTRTGKVANELGLERLSLLPHVPAW